MKINVFFVLLFTVPAMAACDNTTPATGLVGGTPPARIAGQWRYTGEISDDNMASCQITGMANITQTNDQFTGAVELGVETCMYGGEKTEDSFWGPIALGEIALDAIRFRSMGCLHIGTASGSPPNHMVGVTSCSRSIPPETPPRTLNGTWEATR